MVNQRKKNIRTLCWLKGKYHMSNNHTHFRDSSQGYSIFRAVEHFDPEVSFQVSNHNKLQISCCHISKPKLNLIGLHCERIYENSNISIIYVHWKWHQQQHVTIIFTVSSQSVFNKVNKRLIFNSIPILVPIPIFILRSPYFQSISITLWKFPIEQCLPTIFNPR